MNDPDQFRDALGQRVRALRRSAELTQEQLGERAGISAKYVSNVENGEVNPSISVLRNLAGEGFGLSLSAFFNFRLDADGARDIEAEIIRLIESQPEAERRRALRVLIALFHEETG